MAKRKPAQALNPDIWHNTINEGNPAGYYYVVEVYEDNLLQSLFAKQTVWFAEPLRTNQSVVCNLQHIGNGTVYACVCNVKMITQGAQQTSYFNVNKKPTLNNDEISGFAKLELLEVKPHAYV